MPMNKFLLAAAVTFVGVLCACQGRITMPQATTVQGCIARSAQGYTLTEDSGRKYYLSGKTTDLSQEVGHEVLIRGEEIQSASAPEAPPTANRGAQSRIDVASIRSVSDKCGNSGL
jgi:hypothetical protein